MENSVQSEAAPDIEIIAHPTQEEINALEEAMRNDPGEFVYNPPTEAELQAKADAVKAELEATKDAEFEQEDASDGYTLVDAVTYGTESKRIALTDLKPQVKVEYDERAQFGVSAAFTSVTTHSGYVDLRIIADHNSRAALSRKDADGVTYLKVHFRHQDA